MVPVVLRIDLQTERLVVGVVLGSLLPSCCRGCRRRGACSGKDRTQRRQACWTVAYAAFSISNPQLYCSVGLICSVSGVYVCCTCVRERTGP